MFSKKKKNFKWICKKRKNDFFHRWYNLTLNKALLKQQRKTVSFSRHPCIHSLSCSINGKKKIFLKSTTCIKQTIEYFSIPHAATTFQTSTNKYYINFNILCDKLKNIPEIALHLLLSKHWLVIRIKFTKLNAQYMYEAKSVDIHREFL